MSIYKPKRSPYYSFDFEIGNHRFSGTTRLSDECDAQAYEDAEKIKARRLVDKIARDASKPLTIESAARRWWNEHGAELNDVTEKQVDRLVALIGAGLQLHAITDAVVSQLVQDRKRDVKRSGADDKGRPLYRPITNTTVNLTVSLLRRILRRARDNWDATIIKEPVWKKHFLKQTKRPVRELSIAEETRLNAIERPEYAVLRRFAIITGLRRRNLLLTWSQVDFDAGVIRIVSKGGIPRTLPLTREAYAILWAQKGHHPEFVFTYVCERTRRVPKLRMVLRVKGQRYPITYAGFGSNKQNWAKAGVDARIHDLRHTTGMRTLRATGNLKAAQKILGHTDIAITAKFYTDATVEDMRAAMEATAAATPAPAEIAAPEIKSDESK